MYLSVFLFKNKPTGPHEVNFVIGNRRDKVQISCPKGREVLLERGAYYKNLNRERVNREGVNGEGA